ncbi:MAG: hypothetical protein F6K56_03085 [Moorea sp. SIO3G5]|nr:hypothetical protein [Moorena sp. SIO3G5]
MSRSKYTKERVENMLAALREYGTDRVAMNAGNISATTYYKWMNDHLEFAEQIHKAKYEYRHTNIDSEMTHRAIVAANDVLVNGRVTVTHIEEREEIMSRYNSEGNLIYTEVRQTKPYLKTVTQPASDALIKALLPPVSVTQAIEFLTKLGYQVIDPNITKEQASQGLTPDSIDLLKTRILGVQAAEVEGEASNET